MIRSRCQRLLFIAIGLVFCALPVFAAGDTNPAGSELPFPVVSAESPRLDLQSAGRALGDTVFIEGSGFASNETVSILVLHRDQSGSNVELAQFDVQATADGAIEALWVVEDESHAWLPIIVTASGSSAEASAPLTEIDSRLTIVSMPATIMTEVSYEVTVLLEQDCCDGVYAPMPDRLIEFHIHQEECGIPIEGDPIATAVTDENGVATATLTATDVGLFTIGVKYAGEDQPGPDDPPNSACYPDDRVKVLASIDCTRYDIIWDPVEIECSTDQFFVCAGETVCLPTTVVYDGAGDLLFTIPGGLPCTVDPVTGELCLTPDTTGTYYIDVTATDSTGQTDLCTAAFEITMNSVPTVDLPPDMTVYPCYPKEVCIPVTVADVDDNIVSITPSIGAYANGEVCITIDQPGDYPLEVTVVDNCGETSVATMNITADPGPTVFVDLGPDFDRFLCEPTEICIDVETIENYQSLTTNIGQYSAETGQVCFTPEMDGVYDLIVEVTDTCGQTASDTVAVTVAFNQSPQVSLGADVTIYPCYPRDICIAIDLIDVDDNIVDVTTNLGHVAEGQVCVTIQEPGSYDLIVQAVDACGVTAVDTVTITADPGVDPYVILPDDFDTLLCGGESICVDVTTIAGYGSLTTNLGTYDEQTGQVCFTPEGAGLYSLVVEVTDTCGLVAADWMDIVVSMNGAPTVSAVADTSFYLCFPQAICLPVDIDDADQNIVEITTSLGYYDNGLVCFTPYAAGSYDIIVTATDECGESASTTIDLTIMTDQDIAIECPSDTTLSVCVQDTICLPLSGIPQSDDITVDVIGLNAWYRNDGTDQWVCFYTECSNENSIQIMVHTPCSTYTCEFTVGVECNIDPLVLLPPDTTMFLCGPGDICFPAGISDANDNITSITADSGAYDPTTGLVCFTADTAGTYRIMVTALDDCGGEDADEIFVTVLFNEAPVCDVPNDTSMFVCQDTPVLLPVSATDVDGNLVGCEVVGGPGTIVDGNWTYTPTIDETVTVTVRCTDECGAACEASFAVTFEMNQAPEAIVREYQEPVLVCDLANACVDGYISDPDGNLADGWYIINGVQYQFATIVCFEALAGPNQIVLHGVDSCGIETTFETVIEFVQNTPPVCEQPNDTTIFICEPTTICLPLSASDVDDNFFAWQHISGPGELRAGEWCYEASTAEIVTVTLRGLDVCDAYCEQIFNVTIVMNQSPAVVCPDFPDPVFACDLSEICLDGFLVSDADENLESVTVTANGAPVTLNQGQICFTPLAGENLITVSATDSCGAVSDCQTVVYVALNNPPTCNVPNDTTIFLCDLTEVSLPVSGSDIDGNLTGCSIISGPGQLVNGLWTYTPTGDETVTVTIQCTDDCGASCESSFTVTFDLNVPPAVACVDFLEPVFVCNLDDDICVEGFGAIDEDGNLDTIWVTVNGADYPVIEGSICFVPTEGSNSMILYAVDACGETSWCDAVVEVILNSEPVCLMPTDTTLFNCGPVELCLDLMADDSDANLSGWELISGPGSVVEGTWCYTPEGTETVTVTARATDSCGAYCDQTFTVTFEINQPPIVTCPGETTLWTCNMTDVCISGFGASDPEGVLESIIVTANGVQVSMANDTVCFTPIEGPNVIVLTALDACGAESSCETIVTVDLNDPPVCNPPNDTTIVLCEPEEICLPVSATDPNGNLDRCDIQSGVGEIVDGYWCYTPDKSVGGTITVRCFDSCGAYCDAEFTVNIELNAPPIVTDRFMSATLCEPDQLREVGVAAFDPDGDPMTFIMLSGVGTLDTQTGYISYFPDTSGVYTFEVAAYDTCAGDTGFVYDTIAINSPPELITFDSTIYLCNIQEICFDVVATDADGDILNITQESGPGGFTMLTDSSGETCFMPDDVDSATYIFEYCVTDPCTGNKIYSEACPECPPCDPDTIRITVLLDRPPVVDCPEPQLFSICEPETLCFDFDPGDPDLTVNILSQNAIYDAGSVCFDAVGNDQFDIVIEVVDICDHSDTCIVPVTIEGNHAPSVISADDFAAFLCEPSEICFDVAVTDADMDVLTVTVNNGTYDSQAGQVCFNADTAGSYMIIVSAADSCGAAATDTTVVTVDLNEPPYVDLGTDFEVGLCGLTEVCVDITVGDDDGNLLTVTPNLGSYDPQTGKVCFEVDYDGAYELIVDATDECGATATDTVTITVTSGAPPFVDLGDDLDFDLCELGEICVDVNTISVYQSLTTNLGVYNEVTSQVCFTPDSPGEYTMIVTVVDSCDLSASDTVVITVDINSPPVATGMPDTTVYLCYPQAICLPIDISDPDDNIQSIHVNRGSYSNGQVCFTPYDSGTFDIIVTVTDSCGLVDAHTAYVTILTDQGIELVCPNDTTIFTCVGDTFCLPIDSIPEYATVTVTGINTWFDDSSQSVCFLSECGSTNNVTVEATTPCGTFSCSFTVTVECNHKPLVLLPPDSSIMSCDPSEVCVPVGVYDPDGNIADVMVDSGSYYDPLHNRVCFTSDTAGVYNLIVTAVDECGEEDSDTMAVTVEFNTAPFIIYDWADSVITTCQPDICVPIAFGDAEDNLVEVLTDVGYYDDATGEICFTAESSGLYCVEVIAIDECGLADTLDACVTVDIGEFVQINCPQDTLPAEPICGPTEVCVPLDIIGINFTVTASIGAYSEGQLCFPADTAGIYVITVIGSAECNDDTCVVYVEVTIPDEAVISCPADTAVLACGPDTVYLDYTISASVEMVSVTEPAYLSENQVCVPILEVGSLEITMIATSICNSDSCSFTVTADFNSPPEIVSGPDISLTVCEPYEVCIPITYSDIDDNIMEVSSSHGQVVENDVCFIPADFGIHTVVVSVRDDCGETAYDTTIVTILPGGSPLILHPSTWHDTICGPDSVYVPNIYISPSDAQITVLPHGTYDADSAWIALYVEQTSVIQVTIVAEAMCGVDTGQFSLNVVVAGPTAVTCPGVIDTLLCLTDPVELCYPVTVTGSDVVVTVSDNGVFTGDSVCVLIDQPGSYEFTLIATGRCDADTCVTTINVTGDQAPQLFLPEETPVFERCSDDTTLVCIDGIYATDLEDDVTLTQTCGPDGFELITDDSGRVCFLPDAFGLYEFCFETDDSCSVTAGSFFVDIQELEDCDVCLRLSIDGGDCTPVGLLKVVELNIETREWLGGFDILLAYDASVMAFTYAGIEGSAVDGWEYFEYRMGAADCGASCPSGLVRLVGIADINNGPNHPPHETLFPNGVLVEMQFQVANDQNLGDQFLPINFAWYSCADNAFSDTSGYDLFVDVRILNFEGSMIWDENDDVNYPESSRPFGMGTPDDCFGDGKIDPIRCVEYINGGICVIHPDSLDDRGDVNLNGVAYEIADAVVFSNYFIKGLSVFVVNIAGQIAATDVNADGVTLSVADLVLLIRVIVGDADPIPKLSPYPEELLVTTEYSDGHLSVSTDAVGEIGAALFVFDVNDATTIDIPHLATAAEDMDLMYAVVDGELRILIWNLGTDLIEPGGHRLVEIPYSGDAAPILKRKEIVDYQGRPYRCVNKGGELPTEFSLSQNYPNPFNPATSISFSSPQAADWTLHIYNVTGKLVRSFSGHAPAGHQTITWDGLDSRGGTAASGVYFYRLDAGSFTDTKKMVLLK